MEALTRVSDQDLIPAWSLLTVVGSVAFLLSLLNFRQELGEFGVGIGPILAVSLTAALSCGIFYAGIVLARSQLLARDEWTIVLAGFGGGLFTTTSLVITVVVRTIEGRPVSEPLFPVLVVGALGTLGGVLIGQQYVRARQDRRDAEESRDAVVFTNSLLRHDVRNDLQVINGHVSLLLNDEDSEVQERASAIRSQTESIDNLLAEVESLTEVLTGTYETEPVDVVPMLSDIASKTDESHDHVDVGTDLPDGLRVEGGDGLYSVFDNLVENAVQHARNGAVTIRLLAERVDGERARIRVADDGPGIPSDERNAVFERGVSQDDSGGHGLYVARTIVESLDGDITAEESDLGGAAFVVTLHLATDHNTDDGGDRQST